MAKAKLKDVLSQRADETHLQWQARIAARRVTGETRDVLNPFAASQGCYSEQFVHHDETGTKTQIKRNTAASPLTMWLAQGMIETWQHSAIKLCLHLWEFKPPMRSVTASYGERVAGNDDSIESDAAVHAWIDAKDRLARIEGYFPGRLRHYWTVFENCIRFDMPAGVAGSDLGFTGRSGRTKAHLVVCFVCNIVAMKENL